MIVNSKDKLLNQSPPTPNAHIRSWLQDMTFVIVIKETSNFRVLEDRTTVKVKAVIHPFTEEQLSIQPVGQRSWSWFKVYSDVFLRLNNGDKIIYQDIEYQVMTILDYSAYGYLEYSVVKGFQ